MASWLVGSARRGPPIWLRVRPADGRARHPYYSFAGCRRPKLPALHRLEALLHSDVFGWSTCRRLRQSLRLTIQHDAATTVSHS